MILAGAALLTFFHDEDASRASRAIYEATFEAVLDGIRTADLGGSAGTTSSPTRIRHVRTKLEGGARSPRANSKKEYVKDSNLALRAAGLGAIAGLVDGRARGPEPGCRGGRVGGCAGHAVRGARLL